MVRDLFEKFQEELVAYANTTSGRSRLSLPGNGKEANNNLPVVKVTPDGFHQFTGQYNKGRPLFTFTVFPKAPYLKIFGTALTLADIAFENQQRIVDPKLQPLVLPHFMGETRLMTNRLPIIMAATFGPLYPDADAETDTVDGYLQGSDAVSWANAIGQATADAVGDTDTVKNINNSLITGTYYCDRHVYLFKTSGIGAGQQINTATLSLYWTADAASNDDTTSYTVVSSAPATNTALVVGDYDSLGSTDFKTLAYTSLTQSQYNDWALNTNGKAAVNMEGITKLGLRGSLDLNPGSPTGTNRISIQLADNGSNKPKLAGTYSPLSSGFFALL